MVNLKPKETNWKKREDRDRLGLTLLTYKEIMKASHSVNRIKWINVSTMMIANEEGIEKLVDIDDGFKEIAYNLRPLFTDIYS